MSLSANISTFEATRPQSPVRNDTLTYGLTAGYQYALTPAATVGLTAGSSRSEVDIKGLPWISTPAGLLPCLDAAHNVFVPCTIRSTGDNFIGEVFYRQRPEKTVTTELRLSRAIQPSSDGSQVTVDQVAAYLTKEVTPLLSVRLAGQYWKQDAVTRQANALSDRFRRDYYSLEASATRRLNRTSSGQSRNTRKSSSSHSCSKANSRICSPWASLAWTTARPPAAAPASTATAISHSSLERIWRRTKASPRSGRETERAVETWTMSVRNRLSSPPEHLPPTPQATVNNSKTLGISAPWRPAKG